MRTITSPLTDGPSGYGFHTEIDLKTDRRLSRTIQVVFALVVAGAVWSAVGLDLALESSWGTGVTVAVTVVACVAYAIGHEAIHGVLLSSLSGTASRYSLRLPYLTTGNDAFLDKTRFVIAALGPVVIWGAVLAVLFLALPQDFSLTLYVLTALNLAGSAGDYVQAVIVARLPSTAVIRDNGHQTTVWLPRDRDRLGP